MRERTRYLPALDDLIREDRRGAIMDMLQVLRENGAIVDYHSRNFVRSLYMENADLKKATQEDVSHCLAKLLESHGSIQFSWEKRKTDSPWEQYGEKSATVTATLYAVSKEFLPVEVPKEPRRET